MERAVYEHGERVALAQVTLTTILVHLSIVVSLSPWVIEHINKLRRAFI